MRKFFIILLAAALVEGCNNSKSTEKEVNKDGTDTAITAAAVKEIPLQVTLFEVTVLICGLLGCACTL